jgi:hypothetical protein
MATATAAVGTATGLRAWAAARRPGWLTDRRLRALTATLFTLAVAVASAGIA